MRAVGQMLKGRPAAKGIDFTAWNEYRICKEFGWTRQQLREQPAEDIELFIAFMQEEANAEKNKPRREKRG